MSTSTGLPPSARFALWFTAWTTGSASLDEARDAIVGRDAAHDVADLPDHAAPVPLILALGLLRAEGATGAGLALPVPGDPLGLAGPGDFNGEALEAGEAVVCEGIDLGLVPRRTGAGVVWTCHPAAPRRAVPDPAEAGTALRQALVHSTNALADLEVARWRPEVAEELMALRRDVVLPLPPGLPPGAVRVAALATRCRRVVDLALEDDGGSLTTREADARREALRPLDHAARRGLVAACSPTPGR